ASFTAAFSRRGLVAEWGVSWLLPRVVGTAHALDLLFSARKVDAAQAERIGLVNRVLPHAELLPFVRAYVEDMATHCSPASLAAMKRQVWRGWTRGLGPGGREASPLVGGGVPRAGVRGGGRPSLPKRRAPLPPAGGGG